LAGAALGGRVALAVAGRPAEGLAADAFGADARGADGFATDGLAADAFAAAGLPATGFAADVFGGTLDLGAPFAAAAAGFAVARVLGARAGAFLAAGSAGFRGVALVFFLIGMADRWVQTGFALMRQAYSVGGTLLVRSHFFSSGANVDGPGSPGDAGAPTCPLCGGAHGAGVACPRLAQTAVMAPISTPTIIDPPAERELVPGADPFASPSRTLLFSGEGLPPPPSPTPEVTPAVDPTVGSQVGSFKVMRLLGRGGMGTVYLAEHPVIGSRVAVKFLHESLAANPQVVARFYDEARAVNLIGHENIVAIYDLNLLPPNRYYFVMEYLDGETLTARAQPARLEARVALDILQQLCDALQCAHERGVVHRDLKPDNVFLVTRGGKRDFVKLVDFGIAKLRNAASGPGKSSAGLIVGTPEYMAPEQCDDGTIDARTDVYSLGIIAYELFTGRLPFQGRTVTQLLLAHLQQKPPPPSQLAPGIDAALERLILKALEKEPGARHASMAELGAALRAVQEGLEARAAGLPLAPPPAARPAAPTPSAPAAAPASVLATPPAAAPAPEVEVELLGGPTPRRLTAADVSRGGLFVRAETGLPPLFSRVQLAVAHPALRAKLSLVGEVVRHVSPAEAVQWKMAPGFAVQLTELTPERRAALADLTEATRAGARPAAAVPAASADRLRELEGRPAATHYGLLGLPPDAEFGEVRRTARELRAELEGIRARPQGSDQHARATALLARLDAAQHALSVPSERLFYDAQRGNYLGVARCVAAGIPQAVIEARRREYLQRHPGKEKEAQAHLARAQVARKLKNTAAAIGSFQAALAADPLDLAALDAYVAFRRQVGETG
jgi:serine/threonine-protein kinase